VAAPAQKQPMHVQLTMLDGRRFEFVETTVVGDSLVGQGKVLGEIPWDAPERERRARRSVEPTQMTVVLNEIRTLQTLQLDSGKTVLTLAGLALVAAILVALVSLDLPSGGTPLGN
jgi:hypothetical protein